VAECKAHDYAVFVACALTFLLLVFIAVSVSKTIPGGSG
jgi:hypothetical protein